MVAGLKGLVGRLPAARGAAKTFDHRPDAEGPRNLMHHRSGGPGDSRGLSRRDECRHVQIDDPAETVVAHEQRGPVGHRGVDANLMPVIHP